GNYALARSMLDEALVLSRDVGDKFRIALSINSLGELKRLQNHYPAARSFYEEALIRFRDLGYRSNIALTLHNLGHTVHRQGDLEQARNIFWESLTTCYELGDKEMVAGCMAGLGGVAASSGQPVRAAKLLAACEALLKSVSAFLDPADRIEYDRNMAAAQGQLDEQSWQQAWLEGQAMSLEEAIATAFEESNRLVTTPNLC
ncbi:MAG TPA: tetratricopeptide repeat protein, partial [Chloroflexia bacterium]|nr:tetratricopeptide repeat protein [Chloroflexia bacterium]